jgi:hypothetical protein
MRLVSCPRCGRPNPNFENNKTLKCPRCRLMLTLSATVTDFLMKADEIWGSAIEASLRNSKRLTSVIEQHDKYLKHRGDYNIISSVFDYSCPVMSESEGDDDEFSDDRDSN